MNNEKIIINDLWADCLSSRERLTATIVSASMSPIINIGDKVVIKKVASSRIGFGDIGFFKTENGFLVHRIIGFGEDSTGKLVRQMGDANTGSDYIRAHLLQGKVVIIKKQKGEINLESFVGRTSSLFIALSLRLIDDLRRKFRLGAYSMSKNGFFRGWLGSAQRKIVSFGTVLKAAPRFKRGRDERQ